jgi:Transposase IS116/IS110/IS902 family
VPGSTLSETARHVAPETHGRSASATPATQAMKPRNALPGSSLSETARQTAYETQLPIASATPASTDLKPLEAVPGSPVSETARQLLVETHPADASATPASHILKSTNGMPGSSLSETIEAIRAHHRARWFAMGIQQVLDRKLESYIRINKTDWHVGDDDATRDKANKEVAAKIKAARKGDGDPAIVKVVRMTDDARAPADAERARHEHEMETLARTLPVAPWVETVPGLGYLGLATIIAETGDLSNYPNIAKVWKRLGYAPYHGHAGSTWKRPSWRNGDAALTADEWIENPFSGKRYALMHVISIWLKNKQWIGAAKTDDGVGKPNGKFGAIYATRRARTAATHPDWTKQHGHMDALRIMMKAVLKDLWLQWNEVERIADGRHGAIDTHDRIATTATPATAPMKSRYLLPGSPIQENARQQANETHRSVASATPAQTGVKSNAGLPGSTDQENARHQ